MKLKDKNLRELCELAEKLKKQYFAVMGEIRQREAEIPVYNKRCTCGNYE